MRHNRSGLRREERRRRKVRFSGGGGDQAWDLAEFLYFAAKSASVEEGLRLVAEAFLRGYLGQGGGRATITKARSLKYLAPFLPFVVPTMASTTRETLGESGSSS